MPNLENFKSNVDTIEQTQFSPRYTISRVVESYEDDLLETELPADFSDAILENNIEIHLYNLSDNSLIFSDVIVNVSGSIYTKTFQYEDNTTRKLLFIDFNKIQPRFGLPVGRYSATFNFFKNEIGSHNNKILKINRISTSRTEVELKLTDTTQQNILQSFSSPVIPSNIIIPVLKQIFNQSGSTDVTLPISPVKIDSSSLYQNFTSGSGENLLRYNFDEDDGSRIGINTIMQNVLNDAYPIALKTVEDMISLSGSTGFTESELSTYVIDAIDSVYDAALDDEAQNPQNYRFDLI